jgi:hypothetical protein
MDEMTELDLGLPERDEAARFEVTLLVPASSLEAGTRWGLGGLKSVPGAELRVLLAAREGPL